MVLAREWAPAGAAVVVVLQRVAAGVQSNEVAALGVPVWGTPGETRGVLRTGRSRYLVPTREAKSTVVRVSGLAAMTVEEERCTMAGWEPRSQTV